MTAPIYVTAYKLDLELDDRVVLNHAEKGCVCSMVLSRDDWERMGCPKILQVAIMNPEDEE